MRDLSVLSLLIWAVGCVDGGKSGDDTGDDTGGGADIDADGDGFIASEDCDDSNIAINPGAVEICDGLDNDCDTLIDDADDSVDFTESSITIYDDVDGDGFGDDATMRSACAVLTNQSDVGGDCDDANANAFPGNPELCDGADNDCDATTLEAGMAAWQDSAGLWTDWTDTLTAGKGKGTVEVTLDAPGTLNLCEGTWDISLTLASTDANVVGIDGPELTHIKPTSVPRIIIMFTDGASNRVSGVGLSGGTGDDSLFGYTYGGGILCEAVGASLELVDVDIYDNSAGIGAGIMGIGCDIRLQNSTVYNNSAEYAGGGIAIFDGSLSIEDSVISGNEGGVYGGGLLNFLYAAKVPGNIDLVNTVVTNNEAQYGGGLYLEGTTATCTGTKGPSNAGFFSNIAASYSGAVHLNGQNDPTGFTSDTCDYGTSTDDNTNRPTDVLGESGAAPDASHTYEDDASFSCDETGCR